LRPTKELGDAPPQVSRTVPRDHPHLHWDKCTEPSSGLKCNTEGAAVEEISLIEAGIRLVAFKKEAKLALGLVLSIPELHVSCGKMIVDLKTKNGVLGAIDEVTSGTEFELVKELFHQNKGVQELKVCELELAFCKEKEFHLELNAGLGFEQAGFFSEPGLNFRSKTTIVF
jgi:hypothetical protein